MGIMLNQEQLNKIHKIELICLDELVRICDKHNINYFLIGGTLIGAIRHKGFIPWDDDIDIGMLRSDYDKFIEVCKSEIDPQKFFLQIPETDSKSADFEIARLRLNNTKIVQEHRKNLKTHEGFFVEIFPYDSLPDSNFKAFFYSYYFKLLKRIVGIRMGYKYKLKNLFNRSIVYTIVFFSRLIPLSVLYKKVANYHLRYNKSDSKKVFLLGGAYDYKKETHARKTVNEYDYLEFEGKNYRVPKNYDLFLTEQYGNYMQLPPESERINKHPVAILDFGEYESI